MKFLVDTHLLLWAAGESGKLSAEARQVLSDPDNVLLFSAASFWEIAIKRNLGRADFRVIPQRLRAGLLANGYQEIPVTSADAIATERLPGIHRDPFDRMLVAQADVNGLTLLTSDNMLARYGQPVRHV